MVRDKAIRVVVPKNRAMKTICSHSKNQSRPPEMIGRLLSVPSPRAVLTAVLGALVLWCGCSDLRERLGPPEKFPPLTYTADMKPIFDRDCVVCHKVGMAAADYDMSKYDAGVLGGVLGTGSDDVPNVIPGDENSLLIQTVRPRGSMRQYLGGGPEDEAKIVQWVVADSTRKE